MNETPTPEFSRVITIAHISSKGVEEILEPKASERAALAKRFDLVDLPAFKAQITLMPGSQGTIDATGTIKAEVVQRCVVTLEPVVNSLDLDIDIVFIPAETNHGTPPSDELEEEFEFFHGGKIDLGEVVAQQLGVNIDPYPRKGDAALTKTEFGGIAEKSTPFAKLSAVVKSKKNKDKSAKKA